MEMSWDLSLTPLRLTYYEQKSDGPTRGRGPDHFCAPKAYCVTQEELDDM